MIAHTALPHTYRKAPGSYLLLLGLAAPASLEIGRLGRHTLEPGRYVYLGSALGSGGVAARLARHLRPDKRAPTWRPPTWRPPTWRPHWHIDYLTSIAPIIATVDAYGLDRRECTWAQALAALPGATAPVRGFGSSDCRSGCLAHLWRLPDALPLSWIEDELTQCPLRTI